MAREIRMVADYQGLLKTLVWVSLQDDLSISIGMSDRTFVMRGMVSETPLDGTVHRQYVDLESKMDSKALLNPHFTYHPSLKVHLHANGQEEIFAGIMDIDLVVEAEGRLPWIRFISNPIRKLKPFQKRLGQDSEIIRLLVPSDDNSLEVVFDFVKPVNIPLSATNSRSLLFSWGNKTIEVFAQAVPGQKSTLWWEHQS